MVAQELTGINLRMKELVDPTSQVKPSSAGYAGVVSPVPIAGAPPQLAAPQLIRPHQAMVNPSSPFAESLDPTIEDRGSRLGDDLEISSNTVTPRIPAKFARDMPPLPDTMLGSSSVGRPWPGPPGTSSAPPSGTSLDNAPRTPSEQRIISVNMFDAQPRTSNERRGVFDLGSQSPSSRNHPAGLVATPAAPIEDPGRNAERPQKPKVKEAPVAIQEYVRPKSPRETMTNSRPRKDVEVDPNALNALRTSIMRRYGDLRLAFHKFDTSGSGRLTATEFCAGGDVLGLDRSLSTQLFHALQSSANRGKGFVSLEEWISGLGSPLPNTDLD